MAWEFLNSWVDVSWTIIQNSICRKRNQMILPCKSYRASQLCVLIKLSLNQLLSICLSNLSCKLLYFFFIITLFFHRHWEPCKMQIWEKHLHLLCHTLSIASPISICLKWNASVSKRFPIQCKIDNFWQFSENLYYLNWFQYLFFDNVLTKRSQWASWILGWMRGGGKGVWTCVQLPALVYNCCLPAIAWGAHS